MERYTLLDQPAEMVLDPEGEWVKYVDHGLEAACKQGVERYYAQQSYDDPRELLRAACEYLDIADEQSRDVWRRINDYLKTGEPVAEPAPDVRAFVESLKLPEPRYYWPEQLRAFAAQAIEQWEARKK